MNTKLIFLLFATTISVTTLTLFCEKSAYEILGYEPNVSEIIPASETTKTPVIGVLGMGDPAYMYAGEKGKRGKFDTDKTFTVGFSFENTPLASYPLNPITIYKAVRSINVGQENDATALLYTIIQCYKKGHKKIHIFANSRGGGATLTMLNILSNPDQHSHVWKKLGITDPMQQDEIRAMVAAGTIFLAHPLLDHTKAIFKSTKNRLSICSWLPGSTYLQSGFYWMTRAALYCFTRFDYMYQTQISVIINNISTNKWPYSITISLAEADEVTGNDSDFKLACYARLYPERLTVMKGGKSHTDIRAAVQFCREQLFYNDSFTLY